jgi:hypothetical protein
MERANGLHPVPVPALAPPAGAAGPVPFRCRPLSRKKVFQDACVCLLGYEMDDTGMDTMVAWDASRDAHELIGGWICG